MRVFLPQGTLPVPYREFLTQFPIHTIPLANAIDGDWRGFAARPYFQWLGRGKQEHGLSSVALEDIGDQYLVWKQLTEGGTVMGLD